MKKYETYKNSGVEWIGEVPENWKTMRFKHFVEQITTPSTHPHKIALENIESKTGKIVSTDSEFEGNGVAFNVDDIVYGRLRPYLQKVWKAEFEGNAIGDFFVYRVKDNCLPSYLKYVMLSDNFTSAANGSTYGAKMPRVASEFIANSVWFLPSLSEQQAIASYLDYKVGQIDASVSAINSQIDDLKSYRQSIISEAVTKGLNPNVPMKDSGVEWIGEIPEHWGCHPVYVYFDERKNSNYRMQEQNLLSLSYGKIIRKDINTNGGLLPVSFTTYNIVEDGYIIIRPTDHQNDKKSLRT
jgi:type I restriction enzyme S subunit